MSDERLTSLFPDTSATTSGSVHNQSVLKAVGLIGCFIGNNDGKTLTELARRTGMNVSTAFRMLQTLTATSVLRRNDGDEKYYPGPMLLSLAGSLFSSGGYGVVLDIMRDLAKTVGESVSFAIRSEDCATILLSVPSSHSFRFEHRAGSRIPIHCSAAGKVLLAFSGDDPEVSVAALGRLLPMTPKSITRPGELVAQLGTIRQRGYAHADEEHDIGVRSIAMPIGQDFGRSKGALGVQGPNGRMDGDRIERMLDPIRTAAALIAQLPFTEQLPATWSVAPALP